MSAGADAGARVAVVGGGVIGLSIALELAARGSTVTVYADRAVRDTVSAVAGAVWFPFEAAPAERVRGWSVATLPRMVAMASDPASGVRMREGIVVVRTEDVDAAWTTWIDGVREAAPADLPAGALGGFAVELPVIDMPVYLDHLERLCGEAGVEIVRRRVDALEELVADAIVVASGSRSVDLLGPDPEVFPIRGQVVRLENPGLERWYLDGDNPAGLTYVLPRTTDVVCGGSADVGRVDEEFDDDEGERILARARALVPQLADARVISRGVGLRPGRTEVRLERVPGHATPMVACYGHGGAGVTTSWGCAFEVADLVELAI